MSEKREIDDLAPLPEGLKLRRPKFGKVTEETRARLPDPESKEPRTLFTLTWSSEDLGISVRVQEMDDEVSVVVISKEAGPGQYVSVAMGTEAGWNLWRKTLILQETPEVAHSPATAVETLGSIKQLRKTFGDAEIILNAFRSIEQRDTPAS